MKIAVVALGLLVCLSQANAAFVAATYGTAGVDFQQSFARLQALSRSTGDTQVLSPLPFPYMGQLSATSAPVGDWANAYVAETYDLGQTRLQNNVSRLDRTGPSAALSNGAWIFSVTETARVLASGYLDTLATGRFSENGLMAILDDLTDGVRLFESRQDDLSAGGVYQLGGLNGSRFASFTGNLENILIPNHVYRLIYGFGVYNTESGFSESRATGQVQLLLMPVPEPHSMALVLLALSGAYFSSRHSRRPA